MSKMTKNLILYVYSHDFFPIFEIWEVVVLKVVEAVAARHGWQGGQCPPKTK
jgi:hypothetical protein